jgi:hypothetical protein
MKNDTLYGPPKDLFTESVANRSQVKRRARKNKNSEFDSDQDRNEFMLDQNDDEENLAALRKYEINKMRYFYAIVTCNKRSTAANIYKEYNGFEFELTALKLTLSFVDEN